MLLKFKNGDTLEGRVWARALNVLVVRCGSYFYLVNKHQLVNAPDVEYPDSDGNSVHTTQE